MENLLRLALWALSVIVALFIGGFPQILVHPRKKLKWRQIEHVPGRDFFVICVS